MVAKQVLEGEWNAIPIKRFDGFPWRRRHLSAVSETTLAIQTSPEPYKIREFVDRSPSQTEAARSSIVSSEESVRNPDYLVRHEQLLEALDLTYHTSNRLLVKGSPDTLAPPIPYFASRGEDERPRSPASTACSGFPAY
ncbi:hypothetical protein EIP91_010416 [Steccherinum ochraceum]|uniref:Uncharacterized protein n=1 Tax=Steccherinum ochraceum TaxID=92696 RepID=A0A4R0R5Z1_9APHY|nr:hypothetical protein EIP91_010416 [Steccherinum ochraceum]